MPYFLAASQFSIYKIDEKFILFAFFFLSPFWSKTLIKELWSVIILTTLSKWPCKHNISNLVFEKNPINLKILFRKSNILQNSVHIKACYCQFVMVCVDWAFLLFRDINWFVSYTADAFLINIFFIDTLLWS